MCPGVGTSLTSPQGKRQVGWGFSVGWGSPYLVVLVGGHGDEGCLWEHVGAKGCVFGAKSIVLIGLNDVQPWLVLMHGVEDDLQEKVLT